MDTPPRPDDPGVPAPPPAPVPAAPPQRESRLRALARRTGRAVVAGVGRVTSFGLHLTAHTASASVLAVALLALGLMGLPLTETGTRWLLQAVPGLQFGQTRGALLGDFEVDTLSYPIGPRRLVLRQLAWRGVDLAAPGPGRTDWTLTVARLSVAEIDLQGQGDGRPLVLPSELTLPLSIKVPQVEIGLVRVEPLRERPLRDIRGSLELGGGSQGRHQVSLQGLSWDRLDGQGQASMTAGRPLKLDVQVDLAPRASGSGAPDAGTPAALADAWRAAVTATGPLADFDLQARVQARGQSLDAQARVRLEDAMPLAQVHARLKRFDIAAFATGLPATALSGEVLADLGKPARPGGTGGPGGAAAAASAPAAAASEPASLPVTIQADLVNDSPARWDQQGLPLRRLRLQARSNALDPGHGDVQRMDIDFAGNTAAAPAAPAASAGADKPARSAGPGTYAAVDAGNLSGRGSWSYGGPQQLLSLHTEATLTNLQTALLDLRAPNLSVSGPLGLGYEHSLKHDASGPGHSADAGPKLTLSTDLSGRLSRGAPGASSRASRRVQLGAARAASGPGAAAGAGSGAPTTAGVSSADGRHDWPAVRLKLKAVAQASGIELELLDAQSGAARLRASGQLLHQDAHWRLALQSTLDDFDPSLWWPGAADTPWRRGPHRLAGELQAALSLSDQALAASPDTLARLASLNGNTQLRLRSSLLAGVPVAGTLELRKAAAAGSDSSAGAPSQPAAAGSSSRVQVQADVSVGERALANNALTLGGVGLSLQGQLDPLGPDDHWQLQWQARDLEALTPWLRLAGTPVALNGDTSGQVEVGGRWPHLRTQGTLSSDHLLLTSRPALVPDSTSAARTLSLALDHLQGRWTAGSSRDDVLALDLALDGLRVAGVNGAELRGVQLGASGTAAAHRLSANATWVRTPTVAEAGVNGANGTTGANASAAGTGKSVANPASGSGASSPATATGAAANASAPAAPVGQNPARGQASGATAAAAGADSAEPVVPRLWSARLEASGGLAAAAAAPGRDGTGPAQFDWQGRIDQFVMRELGAAAAPVSSAKAAPAAAASATLAPAGAAGAGESAGAWVVRLAPTSLALSLGGSDSRVQLGATQLKLADMTLAIETLRWHSRAGQTDPDIELRARLLPLNVAPLLARAQPGFGWSGDLQLGGRVAVLSTADNLRADLELNRLGGDLVVVDPENLVGAQRLGLSQLRLKLQARDGVWTLAEQVDGSNLGSLAGEQEVRTRSPSQWPGRDDPVSGQVDLKVAQLGNWGLWLPAGWRLSGRLATQAHIAGRLGAPTLSGELSGQQIALRNGLQGVDWHDARLRVTLAGERAQIDEFTVKGGAGTLSAAGQLRLGAAPRLDLSLTADHFAALQRLDRKVVVSGTAELAVDAKGTTIKGKLRADEGLIDVSQGDAPSLADDVVVLRPKADAAAAARAQVTAPRARRSLALDISADLGDNFELHGRGITTRLTGVLRITSPNDKLAINGTISAVDGSYAAYGQKLTIDRGLITFAGAPDNPRLDVQATRPDLDDVHVGVAITGTAQSPRVRLFSEPEMSNTDKLSWLLLGRASDGLGRADLTLLQRAAFSLLAGESDSPSIVQRLGLDQLSLRQTDGTVRETIVSLGKQLSRRWYVGYERSLNASTGSWQLIYRLAQRFTLRAQSGLDNAVDLIWTWKWDDTEPAR